MMYEFLIRIIVCLALSMMIGLERQYRNGIVGLRTNVLVGLGSFMFNYITFGFPSPDQTRMAAAVVSGIGFLGAGIIFRDGNRVKGLNTAATLWCVSAIGVLTSTGMLIEAIVCSVLVIFSNILLRLFSRKIFALDTNHKEKCVIKMICSSESERVVRQNFSKYIEKNSLNLISMEREEINKNQINLSAIIITSRPNEVELFVQNMSALSDLISISWKHDKYYQGDDEDYNEV